MCHQPGCSADEQQQGTILCAPLRLQRPRVIRWQNFYRECKVAFIYLTYLDICTVPPALTLEHTTHHMHADSCSYFLIPSFQATIKSFYATRHGMVLTRTVAVFVLTWASAAALYRFLFFLPFNKNLGWCRCGQHYIWWDNSTSHSSWKGLNKIGSSSQSSRYGNRSLL